MSWTDPSSIPLSSGSLPPGLSVDRVVLAGCVADCLVLYSGPGGWGRSQLLWGQGHHSLNLARVGSVRARSCPQQALRVVALAGASWQALAVAGGLILILGCLALTWKRVKGWKYQSVETISDMIV